MTISTQVSQIRPSTYRQQRTCLSLVTTGEHYAITASSCVYVVCASSLAHWLTTRALLALKGLLTCQQWLHQPKVVILCGGRKNELDGRRRMLVVAQLHGGSLAYSTLKKTGCPNSVIIKGRGISSNELFLVHEASFKVKPIRDY